jgi:hypothetical protein
LEYLQEYLYHVVPINILELAAAIFGLNYIRQNKAIKEIRYFVAFLWITFLIDVLGAYAPVAYFTNYHLFGFVEGTSFADNKWLYNCFMIVSFGFYINFFRTFLQSKFWSFIIKVILTLYVLVGILYLILSDVFFKAYSQFTTIVGTLILIFTVSIFYFEIIKSDILLNLKKFLPFYVSVGILVFYLCVTPLDIFSEYFSKENTQFVKLKSSGLLYANIFMYATFIVGFVLCSEKKQSS